MLSQNWKLKNSKIKFYHSITIMALVVAAYSSRWWSQTKHAPSKQQAHCKSYTSQVYKHLKKCAYQSHLGRQKMGWFQADFFFHGLDLTRTCFPGMYWVLPWEYSYPKGGIIRSGINRIILFAKIEIVTSWYTINPPTTLHMQWNPVTHYCRPMSLCAAGCIVQAKLISLNACHPRVLPEWPYCQQAQCRHWFTL